MELQRGVQQDGVNGGNCCPMCVDGKKWSVAEIWVCLSKTSCRSWRGRAICPSHPSLPIVRILDGGNSDDEWSDDLSSVVDPVVQEDGKRSHSAGFRDHLVRSIGDVEQGMLTSE